MNRTKRFITQKRQVNAYQERTKHLEWIEHCLNLELHENDQRYRDNLNTLTEMLWSEEADHRVTLSELAELREECGLDEFGHTVTIPPAIMVWLRMYTDKCDRLRMSSEEIAGLKSDNQRLSREVMQLRVKLLNIAQIVEGETLFAQSDNDIPF